MVPLYKQRRNMRTERAAKLVWSNAFKVFDIEGASLADRMDESDLTYAFYLSLDDPEVRELLRDHPAIIWDET